MAALDDERVDLTACTVERQLLARYRGCGLHCRTHHNRIAVCDAADYAAGMVCRGVAFGIDDGVVVFGSAHAGRGEAAAELHVLPDGGQPLAGHLAEHLSGAVGKVGVGSPPRTAHTAPDLVQLAQPHVVRVLDDQRVYIGDIDAGLDDGGADQDVRLPVHHGLHDGGQLLLRHLPVAGDDTDLRPQHLLEPGGGGVDALAVLVGGTSLLIVVGVALETYKQLDSELITRSHTRGRRR